MKKRIKFLLSLVIFSVCVVALSAQFMNGQRNGFNRDNNQFDFGGRGGFGGKGGFGEIAKETPEFSLQDTDGKIDADLYSKFKEDTTVYINFSGANATVIADNNSKVFTVTAEGTDLTKSVTGLSKNITVTKVTNGSVVNGKTVSDASGITVEYKGTEKVKYVLSGTLNGTFVLKNKDADCAVVLSNLTINSSEEGPAFRTTSETSRTFLVIPAGTVNTITDNRKTSSNLVDDKKGSIYAKGALIITGNSEKNGDCGKLIVNNKGYKHAVYSKDYLRVVNVDLVVNADGRDCLRAMNAVIVDSGNITLNGNGKVTDEESAGIKVEGEDADEDKFTVTYNVGTGFVIINGGTINITTVGKGITAHWKSDETMIGNASYTEKDCNKSLLYAGDFIDGTQTLPNPYVTINGGTINIKTTGTPSNYCSPEGIEAKNNLLINGGNISVTTSDDGINAGGGVKITGGDIKVVSSQNDAIDANGKKGIEITGGTTVAIAVSNPAECAFDCDNNRFVVTGGLLVGMGSSNYSQPTEGECKQNVLVLSSTDAPVGKTFAITDSKNKPVFAFEVPSGYSNGYQVMVVSSPDLQDNKEYSVVNGVTSVKGTEVGETGLYSTVKSVSGGTKGTAFTTSAKVTTVGNIAGGFGGGFDGGRRGGFGGGNPPEGMQDFDPNNMPPDMPMPDNNDFNRNFKRGRF